MSSFQRRPLFGYPMAHLLAISALFVILFGMSRPAPAQEETPKPVVAPAVDVPAVDKDKLNDLTFDDLKFEMKKGDEFNRNMLTSEIIGYHGALVKLRGYIRPNYKQSGLTKFVFVRDNQECCFGPTAAIYDNVLVRLAEGKQTDFTVRPVTVQGRFALKEYKGPDGNVWSLYRMYDAEIR